jgi:hypothetical protein
MKENWRTTLPLPLILTAFVILYVAVYLGNALASSFGIPVADEARGLRIILICALALAHGSLRVFLFHPLYDATYRKWLSLTPWSPRQPLPKGPIHLIWTDVVAMAAMYLLAYSNVVELAPVPIFVFLAAYLLPLNLTFVRGHVFFPVVSLFLAPLAFYPRADWLIASLVLVGLYVLAMVGLYQYFKGFPWNTDYWEADTVEELRQSALRQKVIGWPFNFLRVIDAPGVTVRAAFLASLLMVWWVHALALARSLPGMDMPLAFIIPFASIYIAFFRTGFYTLRYRAPISLLGRLITGRLIIPRYDKVFIAPICIILAGTIFPLVLYLLRLEPGDLLECSLFMVVFLTFAMPPTLKTWRLTGAHRMANLPRSPRQTPPDPHIEKITTFASQLLRPARQT